MMTVTFGSQLLEKTKGKISQRAAAVRLRETASLFWNEPRQCGFVAA